MLLSNAATVDVFIFVVLICSLWKPWYILYTASGSDRLVVMHYPLYGLSCAMYDTIFVYCSDNQGVR